MNTIFHDIINKNMEVYINDIIVKIQEIEKHLIALRAIFEWMRVHKLKMNPLKCAFGVTAGDFLGFKVRKKDIEVDKNKAKVIIEVTPPKNNKVLQRLIGHVNFLRRFIAKCAGKVHAFLPLLKLKNVEDFQLEAQ